MIDRLACVIAGRRVDDADALELARQIAAAECDLLRIERVRLLLFERVLAEGFGAADLERLDRYERRAFSRRRRAIASLTRLEKSA